MLITLEGPEGSGKTSQGAALADELRRSGLHVLLTREPGGTPFGERARALLFAPGAAPPLDPMTQLLLLSAARARLVRSVLLPAVDRGETVVCVRYADSTRAYQGGGDGIPEAQIEAAIGLATGGLEPDLTLLLDIEPVDGLRRRAAAAERGAAEGWNNFDARGLAYHRRVRAAYLELAARTPERIVTVDAARSWEEVRARIGEIVRGRLEAARGVSTAERSPG